MITLMEIVFILQKTASGSVPVKMREHQEDTAEVYGVYNEDGDRKGFKRHEDVESHERLYPEEESGHEGEAL